MSRPPKPTSEHRLHGTYRDDRHGMRIDDLFTHGEPEKPAWLDDDASWAWDIVMEFLPEQMKCELDVLVLGGACCWFARWRRYDKEIISTKEKDDDYKAVMKSAICWKQFEKCSGKFGLSAVDRARLNVRLIEGDESDEDQAFLNG